MSTRTLFGKCVCALAVLLFVSNYAPAASSSDNGTPAALARIEALLKQVLAKLSPTPPAAQTTTRLLFPFVTNQSGFDTGVAISNTGLDSTGTIGSAGTCTIHYFGNTTGGGAAPAAQTSTSIPAGGQLVFTLSNGGAFGIAAAPGFQGYIEVVCNFPLAHGFGFVSDLGASRLATTSPALVLPNIRTTSIEESAGQ